MWRLKCAAKHQMKHIKLYEYKCGVIFLKRYTYNSIAAQAHKYHIFSLECYCEPIDACENLNNANSACHTCRTGTFKIKMVKDRFEMANRTIERNYSLDTVARPCARARAFATHLSG